MRRQRCHTDTKWHERAHVVMWLLPKCKHKTGVFSTQAENYCNYFSTKRNPLWSVGCHFIVRDSRAQLTRISIAQLQSSLCKSEGCFQPTGLEFGVRIKCSLYQRKAVNVNLLIVRFTLIEIEISEILQIANLQILHFYVGGLVPFFGNFHDSWLWNLPGSKWIEWYWPLWKTASLI